MGIRWTEEEAIEYGFKKDENGGWVSPNATKVKAGPKSRDSGQVSQSKRGVLKQVTGKDASKEGVQGGGEESPQRFIVSITSYRRRHLDPDNLCPKWYIDEIVRAGYIPDDSSKFIVRVEKQVVKIEAPERQRTVIQIFEVF